MINCHLTGGGHEKLLILRSLSHTSTRQKNFCRDYLANRMWFSVVCTLKHNDTRHHRGQNVVDSRYVISHNIKDNERNLCQDLPTNENTDSDLKVRARHYANELLVRVRLSFQKPWKTFANSLNMQKNSKNVRENSNDPYLLQIRLQITINQISICLFTTILASFRLDYEYEIEYEYEFRISNQRRCRSPRSSCWF